MGLLLEVTISRLQTVHGVEKLKISFLELR
jgi:hypothetical protein